MLKHNQRTEIYRPGLCQHIKSEAMRNRNLSSSLIQPSMRMLCRTEDRSRLSSSLLRGWWCKQQMLLSRPQERSKRKKNKMKPECNFLISSKTSMDRHSLTKLNKSKIRAAQMMMMRSLWTTWAKNSLPMSCHWPSRINWTRSVRKGGWLVD